MTFKIWGQLSTCRPYCAALLSLSPPLSLAHYSPPTMPMSSDITAAMLIPGWLLGDGAAPPPPSLSLSSVSGGVFIARSPLPLSSLSSLPVLLSFAPLLTLSRCYGGDME